MVKGTQDYILGYFQPSLAGLVSLSNTTQDYVLGYSQPSLRDLILNGHTGWSDYPQTRAPHPC
jgi:hypothetical protein